MSAVFLIKVNELWSDIETTEPKDKACINYYFNNLNISMYIMFVRIKWDMNNQPKNQNYVLTETLRCSFPCNLCFVLNYF